MNCRNSVYVWNSGLHHFLNTGLIYERVQFNVGIVTLNTIIPNSLSLLGPVSQQVLTLDSCSGLYSVQKMEEVHPSETWVSYDNRHP
jgi:hypothetical protein